jgi:tRNA(adenine34) deaminase
MLKTVSTVLRRFRQQFLKIIGRCLAIIWIYSKLTRQLMDEIYMREALKLARTASSADEVPVGAVIVCGDQILAAGGNSPIRSSDPTAHAEINAIRQACATLGNYRLDNADLYCTLEPCPMCAGAIVHARIRRLIFGARDLRFGGVRSKFRIADSELLNHRVEVVEGVLGVECAELLQEFFSGRRH